MQGKQSQNVVVLLHYTAVSLTMSKGNSGMAIFNFTTVYCVRTAIKRLLTTIKTMVKLVK